MSDVMISMPLSGEHWRWSSPMELTLLKYGHNEPDVTFLSVKEMLTVHQNSFFTFFFFFFFFRAALEAHGGSPG